MSRFKFFTLVLLGAMLLAACGRPKAKPEPLATAVNSVEDYGEYIDVPFTYQGGVRVVQVKINDCAEFPMIFDTGCSGMSISMLELATLMKNGYISEDDLLGTATTVIADGSEIEEAVVNLQKIKIGDYECANVQASVSENMSAPLLLGNEALKDVESFFVDEDNQTIRFYLR